MTDKFQAECERDLQRALAYGQMIDSLFGMAFQTRKTEEKTHRLFNVRFKIMDGSLVACNERRQQMIDAGENPADLFVEDLNDVLCTHAERAGRFEP